MATYVDIKDRLAILGEIVRKTEETRGQKDTRCIILEVKSTYDQRTYQVEFFGRDIPADEVRFVRGDIVDVEFNISQREWNGRVYTRLSGVALAKIEGATPANAGVPLSDEQPF